jgi:hypothetical protein
MHAQNNVGDNMRWTRIEAGIPVVAPRYMHVDAPSLADGESTFVQRVKGLSRTSELSFCIS